MVSKHVAKRATAPPELGDWVDNRLINAHIRVAWLMVLGTLLNTAVIVLALAGKLWTPGLAFFASYTLIASLHRLWLTKGIARGRRQKRPGKIMRALFLNSVWMALCLAVLLALAIPRVAPDDQLLLAICAVTLIGPAAATMRTLAWAAAAYVAIPTLGLAIGLALTGSPAMIGAIVVLLVSSGFLIRINFNARDQFVARIMTDRELAASAGTVKLLLNEYEENSSDWLFQLDAGHRLISVNRRFAQAMGERAEALEGRAFETLFAQGPAREELLQTLFRRKPIRAMVLAIENAAGEQRWWSISGRPRSEAGPVALRGVISDVTAQHLAESQFRHISDYDTLTGLPNRGLFDRTLASRLDNLGGEEMVALLLIDVDNFKSINDLHGHPSGDAFLKVLAERMIECVRGSGLGGVLPLVARLSGDEFAVVVCSASACDHAVRLADRLVTLLASPETIDGHELVAGVSIGIALAPFHTALKPQLQSYADVALNAAKTSKRGGWEMFEPGMDAVLHERHVLARDLRNAVPRGELRLFLQPQIDMRSQTRAGYEALLRWQHPQRGLIGPDQFIPIAEETGLIVQIGEWALRSALNEAARWDSDETIAINLSPKQLASANLLAMIVNALAESDLDPARVEFEITESVLLHNSAANIGVLDRIRALGVRIALDDFGTGYASLNYLLTFPFDTIKIDRSFVADLTFRAQSREIVASVIALANRLGMRTIAEGVETPEQLDILRRNGCRTVQGWLFGEALPSEHYNPRPVRGTKGKTPPLAARRRAKAALGERRRGHGGQKLG